MAQDRGPELRSVTIFFLGLTWPIVMARCYVRIRIIRAFGPDDWTMLGALVGPWAPFLRPPTDSWKISFTIYCAFVICGIIYGTGKHIADLTPTDIMKALKASTCGWYFIADAFERLQWKQFWWLSELPYFFCSALAKISICLFLLHLVVERSHVWILRAIMVVNTVSCVFFFFFMLFQCSPISYFWNHHQPGGGHCLSPGIIMNSTYTFSAISSICDFSLGILPIFMVWNLQMSRRSKCAVVGLLSIAGMWDLSHHLLDSIVFWQPYSACSATIIRIPYIISLSKSKDYLCTNLIPPKFIFNCWILVVSSSYSRWTSRWDCGRYNLEQCWDRPFNCSCQPRDSETTDEFSTPRHIICQERAKTSI